MSPKKQSEAMSDVFAYRKYERVALPFQLEMVAHFSGSWPFNRDLELVELASDMKVRCGQIRVVIKKKIKFISQSTIFHLH